MGAKIGKGELIAAYAAATGNTKAKATEAVNAVIGLIEDALIKGNSVQIVGFGTFNVKQRNARTARHPQTGDPIDVPAKRVVTFKTGKTLADAVDR
jgi:DNA-binding protein HU-beta